MSGNPYAPPQAVVSEVNLEPPETRPREVTRAVVLQWIGFVIADVFSVINSIAYRGQPGTAGIGIILVGIPIGFLITLWINGKILKGRNWARILALIGVVFTPFNMLLFASNPVLAGHRLYGMLSHALPWPPRVASRTRSTTTPA